VHPGDALPAAGAVLGPVVRGGGPAPMAPVLGTHGDGSTAAERPLRAPWHPDFVVILSAVLAAVLLAVFAWVIASSQSTSRDQAEHGLLAQATTAAGLTTAVFSVSDARQARLAAKNYGGATVNRVTLTALTKHGQLAYAYITNSDGRTLAASPGANRFASAEPGRSSIAIDHALQGRPWFSDLFRSARHRFLVEQAIPFPTKFGRRVEVMVYPARLLSGFLSSYLVSALPDKATHGFVLDGRGRIVGGSVAGVPIGKLPSPDFLAILASAPQGAAAHGQYDVSTGPFEGERYVVAAPIGGSAWRVGLTEPTSVLFPPDVGSQSWITWTVFIAFALAAIGCVFFLRRSLIGAARLVVQARRDVALQATNAELDAFSYSVSHDLRAPLRAIDGFSRIALEDDEGTLTDSQRRHLGLVRDNTQTMGDLIDDLLAFSHLASQPLQRSSVRMSALAREVEGELSAEHARRRIVFTNGKLPVVQADPALLRQVLVNLIGNAVKYSSESDPAQITVGSEQQDGELVFCVADNGVGFDMRYAAKLFQVFQRLHRAEDYDGTGVGLAIVERIVTRHGGRVWAESSPGEGATFYFTLSERPS
jgi:signal transduction histidine kinase